MFQLLITSCFRVLTVFSFIIFRRQVESVLDHTKNMDCRRLDSVAVNAVSQPIQDKTGLWIRIGSNFLLCPVSGLGPLYSPQSKWSVVSTKYCIHN